MAGSDSLTAVESCLSERTNFLVEAGAGSGKTYALVHGLRHLLATQRDVLERQGKRVACITYTNVAKDEIVDRLAADPLVSVRTIHEFLWEVISSFPHELRAAVLEWNAQAKKPVADLDEVLGDQPIQYSDRGRKLEIGRISHDEVLALAERMFLQCPKLCRIVADKYPYLLVDEYQDTEPRVVKLLLEGYAQTHRPATVGFFGDSMQKIYAKGVGRLADSSLKVITKTENFRCSKAVIGVLNAMRPDLQQVAAGENAEGDVHFFAGDGDIDLEAVRRRLRSLGWTDQNTKILMLTHKVIGGKLAYSNLLDAYGMLGPFGRDRLTGRDETYIGVLSVVDEVRRAFERQDQRELFNVLRAHGYRLKSHGSKQTVARKLLELQEACTSGTIGDVLAVAFDGLLPKPRAIERIEAMQGADELSEREARRQLFVEALEAVPYSEVGSFLDFVETRTPFSTQHGVKGAEYDNVIVAIDDSAWSLYHMGNMLANADKSRDRVERSLNLFYVCCSRAKSGLAVVFLQPPPPDAIMRARQWFGDANVHLNA